MRERLAGRENWQEEAGERGRAAEGSFEAVMRAHLEGSPFEVTAKPSDLAGIYSALTDRRGRERPHGIRPISAVVTMAMRSAI